MRAVAETITRQGDCDTLGTRTRGTAAFLGAGGVSPRERDGYGLSTEPQPSLWTQSVL